MSIYSEIYEYGVMPVLVIEDAQKALPLAEALQVGKLPVAEVTFRTQAAKASIEKMAKAYPSMLVGAGTVTSVEQVKTAMDAGAKYIVCPSFNPRVVQYCVSNSIPVLPNCVTNYEVEQALELGLHCLKQFPADELGGIKHMKAVNSVYGGKLMFVPTGGINETNMAEYLSYKQVLAVGGSFIATKDMINQNRYDEIAQKARQAVRTALGFSFEHVGVNSVGPQAAQDMAARICTLFGAELTDKGNGLFCGRELEIIKAGGRGERGHLAFKTRNMTRALAMLGREGVELDMDNALRDEKGDICVVYLKESWNGFAVHICA